MMISECRRSLILLVGALCLHPMGAKITLNSVWRDSKDKPIHVGFYFHQ